VTSKTFSFDFPSLSFYVSIIMTNQKLYQIHRKNLLKSIGNHLAVIATNPVKSRNSDVDYLYRQSSDFLYMTNIAEPNHICVFDGKAGKSHLFVPDLDPKFQIWEGHQVTKAEAKKHQKFDHVHYISELPQVMKKVKKGKRKVLHNPAGSKILKSLKLKANKADQKEFENVMSELRVRKDKNEATLINKANQISSVAHEMAMKATRPGVYEHQVQAALEASFRYHGAPHNAYPSIVAGGANAAVLHYHTNNMKLKNGDLLLIDAGCELDGYASDITRTFPVNGKFSKTQAAVYDIVLDCQNEVIGAAKIGTSLLDLHHLSCELLTQGLIDLKIFKTKDVNEILEKNVHKIFFPHGIGHMLGLDVHDVGGFDPKAKKVKGLRSNRVLDEGMVITVEPGLYFIKAHFENKETRKKTAKLIDWKVAEKYRSVGGIRIEDNIMITKRAPRNFTTAVKTRKDIEKVMRT
jgi:Xaa-Pro dipeptidase